MDQDKSTHFYRSNSILVSIKTRTVFMKVIQFSLIGILTLITILWFGVSANEIVALQGVFAWRSQLLQFTGILAMTSLSIGILLAMRFTWVEDKLNGLDKVYQGQLCL
jgi:predicted ferric reductase